MRMRLRRGHPADELAISSSLIHLIGQSQDMHALAIVLKPLPFGWALYLTDGRELARFRGPLARSRALRYLSALEQR